ncbi:MAG: hypothetical protein HQ511_10490 [Rhodospirillales bacterium]|nr:hypothetical protein [Rhodospirillales bacterium]
MNKTLLLTGASAFALILGISGPAFAVDGASASAEGTSSGNTATDDGSERDNLIDESWNGGSTGIVHDQQNNGSNNVLNAATSVHADVTGGTDIDSKAVAKSYSDNNDSDHDGDHSPADRDNLISDTMKEFVGSATLQQNNGDNNAINSATAIDGIAGDAGTVKQGADAQGSSTLNHGDEGFSTNDSRRRNRLIRVLNPADGVFTVQQNNGSANGMSSATAVSGSAHSAKARPGAVTRQG